MEQVVIIGGGCAGLTAAIYAGRALLSPVILTGPCEEKGGALVKTSFVENFPGFPDGGILGFDLMERMERQAVEMGARLVEKKAVLLEILQGGFRIVDDAGGELLSKTVIMATGSLQNRLNLSGEDRLWSKGISSCAVCDGALYRGKKIMVVGGGDSALEEALFLTKFSEVVLVHRGPSFSKASAVLVRRTLENPRISVRFNTTVSALHGEDRLTAVDLTSAAGVERVTVDGLFYGLGSRPADDLLATVPRSTPGLFIAGDVIDIKYRQAVVAAGEGCRAALDAIGYLDAIALI